MKTVWKFPLSVLDLQQVNLPRGAQILSVQTQHEQPCLWALVDPSAPTEYVNFRTLGTGHFAPDMERFRYVGTYQLVGGGFIGHVFVEDKQ